MNTNKLKPGKYWIGDPCYVYPDGKWSAFCNELFLDKDDMKFIQGFHCFGTAYGDGVYNLYQKDKIIGKNIMGELGVDAGLLSIIPMKLVKSWGGATKANHLGVVVEIKEEAEVVMSGKGNVEFGEYEIFTDGSDIEDEDDLDDEEDYYADDDDEDIE